MVRCLASLMHICASGPFGWGAPKINTKMATSQLIMGFRKKNLPMAWPFFHGGHNGACQMWLCCPPKASQKLSSQGPQGGFDVQLASTAHSPYNQASNAFVSTMNTCAVEHIAQSRAQWIQLIMNCTLDQLTTWHQFMIKVHNRLGLITIHPHCTCVAPTCKQACPWARDQLARALTQTHSPTTMLVQSFESCASCFCNHTLKLASQCSWNCTLFGYRICHDATAQA